VPAGEAVDVGGDFYDVVSLPDGRWLVVIGDVSGKGVQAAIVTGLVRDVTRVLVRDGRPVAETLARLNETLVERGGGRFCTLALAVLSRRPDGVVDAALHLAGHDQTVLVSADGRTRLVGRCGTALGLLPTIKSPVEQVVLLPGDMLIFSTDGVTERRHRGVPVVIRTPRCRRIAPRFKGTRNHGQRPLLLQRWASAAARRSRNNRAFVCCRCRRAAPCRAGGIRAL